MSKRPDEDRPSVLEQLQSMLGDAASPVSRSTDRECDECGEVEGSVTVNDEQGWVLCTPCKNDPDVLARHVD